MSKRFEGGLRRVATRLSAMAMRLQQWDVEDSSRRHSQDPSAGIILQAFRYLLVAIYSSLSIHLNLFTSFLAEVSWLTLSGSWVTRRFVKTRQLGSKDENEWTFGQILPLLLVVAPLATVLEHFLPCQVSNNTRSRSPDRIALLTRNQSKMDEARVEARNEPLDQPDTDEVQVEAQDEARDNVRADMDHQHIHSIAYRGTFFLAAVAYIEVGIFFVAELSPGIKEPLIRLGVAFFVLNPLLQLLWIYCTL
ncbi:hypothetical protein LCI18_005866 [Fusarium solani-melongenae]|uniref:Uncharacterized protein n=1 Tax=Fusarium solani subsp. cucurbitae TaxID=2747967 RepID=A0ACD3Z168_FUSSC|nr:hypothetical protein LCI18_005866 [Fusarium solani-melongenae]